jgi:RNA polymerase sigma factor (sigma-70 family)
MDERQWLVDRFEDHRAHLQAVAYRMLGSLTEADDAVQDAWVRASRAGAGDVENLGGWLTTVVARVCLNMLRSRNSRREEPLAVHVPDPVVSPLPELDPEEEAQLADSVGLALLVVLDTLAPAERLAFVLHDMFDLAFEEIAPMVDPYDPDTYAAAETQRCRSCDGGISVTPQLYQRFKQTVVADWPTGAEFRITVGEVRAWLDAVNEDGPRG